MGIYITPLERVRTLQRENARLRSLVGEPEPVEPADPEGGEQAEPQTLIEKTDTLQVTTSIAFALEGGIEKSATEHHTFAPWVSGYNYLGALRVYG